MSVPPAHDRCECGHDRMSHRWSNLSGTPRCTWTHCTCTNFNKAVSDSEPFLGWRNNNNHETRSSGNDGFDVT